MNRSRRHLLVPLAAALAVSVSVHAQVSHVSTGQLSGLVLDTSGGVVQCATIELAAIDASSAARTTRSNQRGRYTFDDVEAGVYRVLASFPGFESSGRTDAIVKAGRLAEIVMVLAPARQEVSVVVTAPPLSRPLVVETDPRVPRQPIPAHDGGDYLKAIPGFSLVRKGGTDGDPVLRGMAGSRLAVLLDGQQIFGGCGGRMDPPTAYVYPSAYDHVTVVKGPETVLYAPGASAGVAMFSREIQRAARPDFKLAASQIGGGFGRHDEMADVRVVLPAVYFQGTGTRSHTGDYTDGDGAAVHSAYTRWSGNTAVGWTPSADTLFEVSGTMSDGAAAYADRTMDGTQFARQNVALRFDTRHAWWMVQRVQAQAYYNYVDHVMDNYSLRQPGTTFMVNNPDRKTTGARVAATLATARSVSIVVGADTQHNLHTFRSGTSKVSGAAATTAYTSAARVEDVRFSQVGAFAEGTIFLTSRDRLITGARADWHQALDSRATVGGFANDTRGMRDRTLLKSAFGRYERSLTAAGSRSVYVGVGHAERTPDYWERLKQDPVTLKSAFLSTRPEKTTQLDAGFLWKSAGWNGSISAFAGKINDYILIRWSPTPAVARNVDATTLGAEAEVSRQVTRYLRAEATVAYVRSSNDTDHKPLALQPPTEGTLGVQYAREAYSLGALARLVAAQNRVDVGSGNIVANGMDLGPSAGFSVFSANGTYRFRRGITLACGIDNLFNRTYAEHISKGGAMVPDFVQTFRINEPGRTLWLKLNVQLD
jgi:iron complex outermembrane recepter protein